MGATVEARDGKFFLRGQEFRFLSGAMHYFRVVPEKWKERMLQMKACGLNTIETYVAWNAHEAVKGTFNFSGNLDLRRYILTAKEVGLFVLLRPGPYICAEWDFGGLPSWLLQDPDMKIRTAYPGYIAAVDKFLTSVLEEIIDLQYCKDGPIVGFQLENEYGSYDNDLAYKEYLMKKYRDSGVVELMFTSDNGKGIQQGSFPGVLTTANFQEQEHGFLMFEYLKNLKQPGKPLMVMEFWSGWFDHWGEKHHVWPLAEFEKVLRWVLQQGASINFYMFHGGTNFGFFAGANEGLGATNEGNLEPYAPDITSYDYDCPISEDGQLTEKWHLIKSVLAELCPTFISQSLPDPPQLMPAMKYGSVTLDKELKLKDLLPLTKVVNNPVPLYMEHLPINSGSGQGHGLLLYRTTITLAVPTKLSFPAGVQDRAVVYLDGDQIAIVDWLSKTRSIEIPSCAEAVLDILVENTGRVNYAEFKSPVMNQQRKGLCKVYIGGKEVTNWTMYPLDFKEDFMSALDDHAGWTPCSKADIEGPVVRRGYLEISGEPRDTFVSTEGWRKGFIFINGFNIGRYWDIGPQKTMYIPGSLLKQGRNTVLVFEMHQPGAALVFGDSPDLGLPVHAKTVLTGADKAMVVFLRNAIKLGPWVWKPLKLFMKT